MLMHNLISRVSLLPVPWGVLLSQDNGSLPLGRNRTIQKIGSFKNYVMAHTYPMSEIIKCLDKEQITILSVYIQTWPVWSTFQWPTTRPLNLSQLPISCFISLYFHVSVIGYFCGLWIPSLHLGWNSFEPLLFVAFLRLDNQQMFDKGAFSPSGVTGHTQESSTNQALTSF